MADTIISGIHLPSDSHPDARPAKGQAGPHSDDPHSPRWLMFAWYSLILTLLVEIPLLLPVREDLLAQFRIFHPSLDRLSLVAWRISGVPSEQRAFHRTLSRLSFNPEGLEPWQATMPNGQPLLAGVVTNSWIPIKQL